MPSKMIPFPYEIKITHPDFCYNGIYYSNKQRWSRGHKDRGQGHKANSRTRTKDTTRKLSQKKSKTGLRSKNLSVLQEKNMFRKIFASSLAFFNTKQNWSWPWPIFNKSKHSAVLKPRRGIFEDLQASRPKPRTLNFVLEAKEVLEESSSTNIDRHSGSLFWFYFFIFMKTNSERINCLACTIVTFLNYIVTLYTAN